MTNCRWAKIGDLCEITKGETGLASAVPGPYPLVATSADAIIATQMIESWFFYDIEGIYKFLKVPRNLRKPTKFKPPEKFTHHDLSKLFARFGKTYIKGRKCANFISNLDIQKILENCFELRNGLEQIKRLM